MTRKNCPLCNRYNSVRVLNKDGKTIEHCFGADCNYYKADKQELDLSLNNNKKQVHFDTSKLVHVTKSKQALEFIQKYHCSDCNINISYYPKDDRVMFDNGTLFLGRALDKKVQPKWYVYTTDEKPFIVQHHKKQKTRELVIVEDVLSACTASKLYDSLALQGTTLKDNYLTSILEYDKIYICLDEDATSKALKMQALLSLVKDAKVVPLKKDIKYLNPQEVRELLNE